MSNTIPDVQLVLNTWLDAYELTGITPGSSLIIRNKASAVVYINVNAAMPPMNSTDGWDLASTTGERWTTVTNIPTGSKVWIKGTNVGKVSIQTLDN